MYVRVQVGLLKGAGGTSNRSERPNAAIASRAKVYSHMMIIEWVRTALRQTTNRTVKARYLLLTSSKGRGRRVKEMTVGIG